MSRFARPSKSKPTTARDGTRQVLVVLAIAAALTLGLFATNEYLTARQRAVAEAAAAATPSDDEIYTGSILYTPDEGRICHQILFDNRTGIFADNGSVDCERAAYQSSVGAAKQWSAARVRVISTGFRQR
jgi:hypothetical protein